VEAQEFESSDEQDKILMWWNLEVKMKQTRMQRMLFISFRTRF
jgi:hypothetical protein